MGRGMSSANKGWKDILDGHFDKRARDFIHTSFPAVITRVVNSGVVDVQPTVSTKRADGTVIPYGELFDVRIQTYGVDGDIFISLPIRVGMKVWVFVSERDTADYMQSEQIKASTTSTHDLSDCFCIPQFFTDKNIPEFSSEDIVIKNTNSTITVKPSSTVIEASNIEAIGEVGVTGNLTVSSAVDSLKFITNGEEGVSGTFTSQDSKTITVKNGIITKIL